MHEDDLQTVLGIEETCNPYPWSEGIFLDCQKAGYSCWVMESHRTVIGFIIFSISPAIHECHILNIGITPMRQREGLGSHLLQHGLTLAKTAGATMAFLEVRASNHRALKLYRRFGFNEIGIRRDYYRAINGQEDAIMLAREL